ncbi:MAG: molecular chaperone [Vibrio sp.]
MFIGFDYGTANCSVAIMQDGQSKLLNLEQGSPFIPSTLSAPSRESVTEYLYRFMDIQPFDAQGEQGLRRAINLNKQDDIELIEGDLLFGQAALDLYLRDPSEVYYVKSPKSFLGASGLQPIQLSFFEDLVCAMMANIKQQAEHEIGQNITQAMIGRPINFQGRGGEASNQQAQSILERAAQRAGFSSVAFQYEPVAAGLDYEASLTSDKKVLVVDIGGGTTDCSMLLMGPSFVNQSTRTEQLLAHSGQRVGGNDLDIHLAYKQIMPHFGLGGSTQSGIALPNSQFWNPIAINDVMAQKDFYASSNRKALKQLIEQAKQPERLAHLLATYEQTAGHQIVRCAEDAKIGLSQQPQHDLNLGLSSGLIHASLTDADLESAIEAPLIKMAELIKEILNQSQTKPDVVYMTGGSARSPLLQAMVKSLLPEVDVVGGDYFGSVTSGLARWGQQVFNA